VSRPTAIKWFAGCSSMMILLWAMSQAYADGGGDPAVGKRQFAPCTSCHSIEADAPDKIGPSLHSIVGRKAGSLPGFSYSEAMQKSGIVWDEHLLDAYIKQPSAVVPGNKMAFFGVKNDQARADIIAYLKEAAK
jgi:cytochrome c